jgi:hypothetical protein
MDRTRRWQVATAVTALAGLGIASASLSGSTEQPVAPIVLDHAASDAPSVVPTPDPPSILDDRADIVSADVREDVVSPPSPISLDSPDEAPTPTPTPSRSLTPTPPPSGPATTTSPSPRATPSTDASGSVDSVGTSGSSDD